VSKEFKAQFVQEAHYAALIRGELKNGIHMAKEKYEGRHHEHEPTDPACIQLAMTEALNYLDDDAVIHFYENGFLPELQEVSEGYDPR
jgi:hypothetical protein